MPAWLWITALAAVAFVFWIGWGRGWLRAWRYDWQRAQHVRERAREEVEAASVFYGSMGLTDEQVLHHELPWWPAPPVDPDPWLTRRVPDWREQTAADLSPEALDLIGPDEIRAAGVLAIWAGLPPDDPGPGDAAVDPPASSGPDQVWADRNAGRFDSALAGPGSTSLSGEPGPATLAPSRWLAEQLDIQRAWWDWQMEKVRIFA